jgi:hypothetical protein
MLRRALARAAAAATIVTLTASPAGASPPGSGRVAPVAGLPTVGPWHATGSYLVSSIFQNQGLATVALPGGRTTLWYDGNISVVPGWPHVGDPDSIRGYIAEPYQSGSASPTSKMFRVLTPAPHRRAFQFVHQLVPGEQMNNSFAAIAPSGRWLVSGEWGTMNRLLVFPMPLLNARDPAADLPLQARILLDQPVTDIQGCVFTTATRLLCSSDAPDVKPLLQIDLPAPLAGHDVTGHVSVLGALPLRSPCTGTFEAEGLDYDHRTGILRVEVIQPGLCIAFTTVWEFR